MATITLLLENAWNAPWPKEFNSEPFFTDEDLTPVTNSDQIRRLDLDMQYDMANGVVENNEHIERSLFWGAYIFPLKQELVIHGKLREQPKI